MSIRKTNSLAKIQIFIGININIVTAFKVNIQMPDINHPQFLISIKVGVVAISAEYQLTVGNGLTPGGQADGHAEGRTINMDIIEYAVF